MQRPALRHIALWIACVVGLAACSSGTDSSDPSAAATSTPTSAGTTSPNSTYPTDGGTALVRIGRPGELPWLIIGGDGWVYSPNGALAGTVHAFSSTAAAGAPAAVPPPPAPMPVTRRRLTASGLETVMALAEHLGLLASPPDYPSPGTTDLDSTEVSVTDSNGTYVHDAYALGLTAEAGARKQLLDFVHALSDIEALVGADQIGPAEAYVPTRFVVTTGGSYASSGQPADWPAHLAIDEGCVQLPVDRFPTGVAGLYTATVDGHQIRIAVVPDLPGDFCK